MAYAATADSPLRRSSPLALSLYTASALSTRGKTLIFALLTVIPGMVAFSAVVIHDAL